MEDKICNFKKYAYQSLDLMIDAYKWKIMSENCDDEAIKNKYVTVSNTLFDLFMEEHKNIGEMFKS